MSNPGLPTLSAGLTDSTSPAAASNSWASDPAKPLRLCIVSPALPPKLDGIGDYTSLLARELSRRDVSVTILTDSRAVFDPIEGVRISPAFDPNQPKTNWNLRAIVESEKPDCLLVQYNPFGYGRRGFNMHLYRVLREVKQSHPSMPLAVMFHETYVPPVNIRLAVMAVWQRWQFRRVGRTADVMFYSISPWAEVHRSWFPDKPIFHLPVGSNIPRVGIEKSAARARLGIEPDEIVLGVFGNAHKSRSFGLVREAAEAVKKSGRRVRVLYIGPDGQKMTRALEGIPAVTDGPLPVDEVSRRLSATDVFLATYTDGVSTRRGAMMAALQHGLAVVGTLGIHTDPELAAASGTAMLLVPARQPTLFCETVAAVCGDPVRRQQLSEGALALFDRRYCWPAIATNMLARLPPV